MTRRRVPAIAATILGASFLGGCAVGPVNPSFPVTVAQARTAIGQMQKDPKPLARPLVIIGGFGDPGLSPLYLGCRLERMTRPPRVIEVSVFFCQSFEECRKTVINAVDRVCPSNDPQWTSRVDVVGISLGGLVARFAAAPSPDITHPRRLNIGRLFCISSPQSGAILAQQFGFTQFHRDIRPGSEFLKSLAADDAMARYQLIPYVHLGDPIVGPANAAPPGQNPYWLANLAPWPAHQSAAADTRILADIARRLRDEPPLSKAWAAPLPHS